MRSYGFNMRVADSNQLELTQKSRKHESAWSFILIGTRIAAEDCLRFLG